MDLGLKGKRAIVMAASRGLGFASAMGLAREGCHLVICSRDRERIEEAAQTIRRDTGADVRAIAADVSSAHEAARLVETAVEAYGGLEIVVHNAGGPPAGETLAMTEPQWQKAFEQNLLSFTRIVHAAVPEMKKAGYGRILTIASSSIKQPIPNLALSNALRAGVWGLAKTLSRELASHGILVNVDRAGPHSDRAHRRARSRQRGEERQVAGRCPPRRRSRAFRSAASAVPRSLPTSSCSWRRPSRAT